MTPREKIQQEINDLGAKRRDLLAVAREIDDIAGVVFATLKGHRQPRSR